MKSFLTNVSYEGIPYLSKIKNQKYLRQEIFMPPHHKHIDIKDKTF